MRATIDPSGRLVIPKALREAVGITEGEVELIQDGTGVRVEPITDDNLVEEDGRLVIPGTGTRALDDDEVRRLRDAGQR